MAGAGGNNAELTIDGVSIKTVSKNIKLGVKSNTGNYVVFGSQWEKSVSTANSWEISADAVLDTPNVLSTLLGKIDSSVALIFYPEGNVSGKKYYSGTAVVTSLDYDAPADDLIGVSIALKGNGALTEATVP